MEEKRFEIIGESQGKKFEILSVTPTKKRFEIVEPKKKFDIEYEDSERVAVEWYQQANANDCGPCLILNGLRRIEGASHIPSDINEVRQDINRLRRERGQQELDPSAWLTSEDVGRYLSEVAGLNVEEYACFRDVADETSQSIRDSLEQRSFEMIYSTAGRHFRGIVPFGDGDLLLDSLADAPREQTAESINEMIGQSVNSADRERVERLGIVRQGEAGYTVRSF